MRHSISSDNQSSESAEALADIALNSFGMVMIILLVCILALQQSIASPASSDTTKVSSLQPSEQQDLKDQLAELQDQLEQNKQDSGLAGLWSFRIHVEKLVGYGNSMEPADFDIEYFIWLDVDGDKLNGSLFGVKESPGAMGSMSHATITGTRNGSHYEIVLHFNGAANGGTEVLRVEKVGERFLGRLDSGKTMPGYRNYTGQAIGSRLNKSVFSS